MKLSNMFLGAALTGCMATVSANAAIVTATHDNHIQLGSADTVQGADGSSVSLDLKTMATPTISPARST
jgi:hypothetical protein